METAVFASANTAPFALDRGSQNIASIPWHAAARQACILRARLDSLWFCSRQEGPRLIRPINRAAWRKRTGLACEVQVGRPKIPGGQLGHHHSKDGRALGPAPLCVPGKMGRGRSSCVFVGTTKIRIAFFGHPDEVERIQAMTSCAGHRDERVEVVLDRKGGLFHGGRRPWSDRVLPRSLETLRIPEQEVVYGGKHDVLGLSFPPNVSLGVSSDARRRGGLPVDCRSEELDGLEPRPHRLRRLLQTATKRYGSSLFFSLLDGGVLTRAWNAGPRRRLRRPPAAFSSRPSPALPSSERFRSVAAVFF